MMMAWDEGRGGWEEMWWNLKRKIHQLHHDVFWKKKVFTFKGCYSKILLGNRASFSCHF